MGHVEIGGGEGLDVVDVNVVDGERLSWSDVKGAAHPVDFQGSVDLAAFAERALFCVGEGRPVLALLDAARVELPVLLSVGRIKTRTLRLGSVFRKMAVFM
jgi:hypothetical protein